MHCKNSTFIGESLQDWYGKVNDFSVTQVLREINFRELRSFAILWALILVDLENFTLKKVHNKQKFRAPQFIKMIDFETLD